MPLAQAGQRQSTDSLAHLGHQLQFPPRWHLPHKVHLYLLSGWMRIG
jgi:hypothetical protein